MRSRHVLWSGLGAVGLLGAIGGAWILSLPPAAPQSVAPPIAKAEADATLAALKPPKRQRPLIAIIGINDATEVTDYIMPYGILRRSDIADVVMVATEPGPVKLYPVLRVEPEATVAQFDTQHPDRRIVVDQGVATTTGITASIPDSLTLIEAIAGRDKAEAVGRDLGVTQWDARHDSSAFQFTRPFALTAIGNTVAFWNREQLGIELRPDVDEVSLALVADAWSRTYRSRAVMFAGAADAVESRNGLRILPDRVATSWPAERLLPTVGDRQPARALDDVLEGIAARYGTRTADFVALQLEYPR